VPLLPLLIRIGLECFILTIDAHFEPLMLVSNGRQGVSALEQPTETPDAFPAFV
jgi:hypothetical protein